MRNRGGDVPLIVWLPCKIIHRVPVKRSESRELCQVAGSWQCGWKVADVWGRQQDPTTHEELWHHCRRSYRNSDTVTVSPLAVGVCVWLINWYLTGMCKLGSVYTLFMVNDQKPWQFLSTEYAGTIFWSMYLDTLPEVHTFHLLLAEVKCIVGYPAVLKSTQLVFKALYLLKWAEQGHSW